VCGRVAKNGRNIDGEDEDEIDNIGF